MSLDTVPADTNQDLLADILSADPGPFAIIYRPETSRTQADLLTGSVRCLESIDDIILERGGEAARGGVHSVLAMIPYRQIRERGYDCIDDKAPLVALDIETQATIEKQALLDRIPQKSATLNDCRYDLTDHEYAGIAAKIIADEIGVGAGANFVLKRSYLATIDNHDIGTSLSIFRNLMEAEVGAYWIFIVHTGETTLIGASPERHITLNSNTVVMNPISGTYRYPTSADPIEGLLDFLADRKEIEELYMVVDEELKMMSRICTSAPSISGPSLKPMAKLAHTEYFLQGHSLLHPQELIKQTLFAPTIIGSPLENACRVISRYERTGRGYYSGVLSLFGSDIQGNDCIDSAILIRTAHISSRGELSISVGSTLVRDSNPLKEASETSAKAAGLLSAITRERSNGDGTPNTFRPNQLAELPAVKHALGCRNATISTLWRHDPTEAAMHDERLKGKRVLIVDAEDSFTSMLSHLMQSLGLQVEVTECTSAVRIDQHDLLVLGPGPGNPNNHTDQRVAALTAVTKRLLADARPFLSICLSHQVLCLTLGIDVYRKATPNQGLQQKINLFGEEENVGFYNSYSARFHADRHAVDRTGLIEVCRSELTNEVHALRAGNFASMQFHPESILTQNGRNIVKKRIIEMLSGNKFMAQPITSASSETARG